MGCKKKLPEGLLSLYGFNVKPQKRMDSDLLYYVTGEEVHAGDRVQRNGEYATVVFVSNGETEEFEPGYEDYSGSDRGILLCDDDGVTTFIGDPDQMLTFVDRR